MKHSILVLLGSILLMNCTRPIRTLDLQGHRGARGLFPENSLLGFEKALEIPEVSTLELDLCVTADDQLIVSHEPWINEQICTINDTLKEGRHYSLYKMTYDSILQFDCGSKGHSDFPEQQLASISKPLLKELFAMIDEKGLRWPNFNIEIKSRRKGDHEYHPGPKKFAALVVETLNELNEVYPKADVLNKVSIQSFDFRALREVRKTALPVKLSLITEKTANPAKEMDALGFPVDIYSPSYELVTPELISWCHFRQIAVIPWTVNELDEMQELVDMGVDGLISDYPDHFNLLVY
ncbi:glycerophosphodiester phosphodiesterase family protein [Schleiferiaceae bacterium]|nr:glycerophosphodiester phosphodiesterase family protein [Schleiferiaceae bacterium]